MGLFWIGVSIVLLILYIQKTQELTNTQMICDNLYDATTNSTHNIK